MRKNLGFSLVELAVVLVVLSIVTATALKMINSVRGVRERVETKDKLANIEQAMHSFAYAPAACLVPVTRCCR